MESRYLKIPILAILISLVVYACDNDNDNKKDPDQVKYDAASAVNGGRLYDKFWADETDYTSPADPSVDQADIEDFGNFYRCKQCHGWDQLANMGAYIDRGPKISRPSVSAEELTHATDEPIRDTFDEIMHAGGGAIDPARTADGTNAALGGNNMPDFSKILTEDQVWDLVKFLKEGTLDTDQLYTINTTGSYPTGSRNFTNVGTNGDAVLGALFYSDNCAACHGNNGRDDGAGNILAINADIGRSMGEFAREKPYEMQHKARYGNLGSSPLMLGANDATLDDIKNMFKALSDTNTFPDL